MLLKNVKSHKKHNMSVARGKLTRVCRSVSSISANNYLKFVNLKLLNLSAVRLLGANVLAERKIGFPVRENFNFARFCCVTGSASAILFDRWESNYPGIVAQRGYQQLVLTTHLSIKINFLIFKVLKVVR